MDRMTKRSLQILLALAGGPLHGYGIKQDIAQRTSGRINLGSGTLYEAIQRLEGWGWIQEVPTPEAEPPSGGPRRRFFALTPLGERALSEELRRLDEIVDYARERDLLKT
jgi:DNA-binding PadR family transcriptional regulator